MNDSFKKLQKCVDYVRSQTDFAPRVALVLGSGLGGFADTINAVKIIDFADIEGFPVSTVQGHNGRFVFGTCEGVPTVIMQGRVHYYEGYEMTDVVLPIRLMSMLGAEILMLTNAAGGISEKLSAGSLMLINGQISSFVPSPLRGENFEKLGTRFPDMSHIYCEELRNAVKDAAKELDICLHEGVYLQTSGPNYESPEEIRMYSFLGADAVGMSTACEAIAAVHCGMRVCGISCISNMAAGISKMPLTHQEVQETADKTAPIFRKLLTGSIARFGRVI